MKELIDRCLLVKHQLNYYTEKPVFASLQTLEIWPEKPLAWTIKRYLTGKILLTSQKSGWRKCERYGLLFALRSPRTPFLDSFRIADNPRSDPIQHCKCYGGITLGMHTRAEPPAHKVG
jgi:hypothetical protein